MGSELDGAGALGETELRGMQLTMGDSIRMQPMSPTAHLKMARMVIVCVCFTIRNAAKSYIQFHLHKQVREDRSGTEMEKGLAVGWGWAGGG